MINESLKEILNKEWEDKPIKEIIKQTPEALQGINWERAEQLKAALGVKTIKDLATNKFILWAQALNAIAPHEK